jgi:hypothetical protein
MSLSLTDPFPDESTSERGKQQQRVSTIGEDFYNSIENTSYISDDEKSGDDDGSGDTPVPYPYPATGSAIRTIDENEEISDEFLPPNASLDALLISERSGGVTDALLLSERSGADALMLSERSGADTMMVSERSGVDGMLVSERSGESKGSAGKRDNTSTSADTLLLSERSGDSNTNSGGKRDVSFSKDVLLVSERSGDSKGNSRRRESSLGKDNLTISERSSTNFRDHSGYSGYDSLMISETTKALREDDGSSISSTPSNPFPLLEEDRESVGGVSQSGREKKISHEGSDFSVLTPPETISLSQRMLDVVESHPLAAPSALAADAPELDVIPSATMSSEIAETSDEEPEPEQYDDEEISLKGDDIDSSFETKTRSASNHRSLKGSVSGRKTLRVSGHRSQDIVSGSERRESGYETLKGQDIEVSLGGEDVESGGSEERIRRLRERIRARRATPGTADRVIGDYDGSISTTRTLRDNERAGRVPRRWIFDRIDGTVKVASEEAEEGVPKWRRTPPFFLCLPSPLLGVFPWWLEENCWCVTIGRLGCFGGNHATGRKRRRGAETGQSDNGSADQAANENEPTTTNSEATKTGILRTLVLAHAMLLNACGLFATLLSGVSLAKSSSLLEAVPFGMTTIIPTLANNGTGTGDPVNLYLGLLALGIENPTVPVGGTIVVGFRNFCKTPGTEQFLIPGECNRCANVDVWIVLGFFLATVSYVPIFAIGIGRLYRNYDANCSKVAAGIWSLISLSGYLIVLACFHSSCLESMFAGEALYTSEGSVYMGSPVNGGEEIIRANFKWKMGVGQILFLIGAGLKVLDFLFNCCIATPAITRSRELQWEYEEGSTAMQGRSHENGNPQEGPAEESEC